MDKTSDHTREVRSGSKTLATKRHISHKRKCMQAVFFCDVPFVANQTAITSSSGSTSCFNMLSIAINVPVRELGQLPHAP